MQCEQILSRLNELCDRRESVWSDAEVRAHAEQCSSCRQLVSGFEVMLTGVENLHPPELSRNLHALPAPMAVETSKTPGKYGWILVAAAIVAILALSPAIWHALRPAEQIAQREAEAPILLSSVDEATLLSDDSTSGASQTNPGETDAYAWDDLVAANFDLANLPQKLRMVTANEATHSLSAPLRVVTEPLGAAWQALLKSTLPSRSSTPSKTGGTETGHQLVIWPAVV